MADKIKSWLSCSWLPAALLATLFFLFYSTHTLYRHFSYNSHALDLGIYVQALYLYSHNLPFFSSLMHLPLLADHFGPILLVLSPLYQLLPDASFLLILQALMVATSSFPVFLIAKDKTKNQSLSLLITLSYLAAPGLLTAVNFDFHLATISALPLSLVLFSWYFRKWRLYTLMLFLAILFKEDIPLFLFGLGLFQLAQKQTKVAIPTIAFSIISFYLIKFQFVPAFWPGAQSLDISSSLLPLDDPLALLITILMRPTIISEMVFNSPVKLHTIDTIYRQFAFLPLLTSFSWLTVFPFLMLRFSSTYPHFWTTSFHYDAILTPFLAVSAVFVISKYQVPVKITALLLLFFIFTGGLSPNSFIWQSFSRSRANLSHLQYLDQTLASLPPQAAVAAQSPIVPHLANREKIYLYPEVYDAQYIVLDTSLQSYPLTAPQLREHIDGLNKSPYWKAETKINNLVIFKRL